MRKALATGLAMGIMALGSIAAPSSASALAPGQFTQRCTGWIQHSNSAVYWRTCAKIVQRTSSTRYANPVIEVKNFGAKSKVITGMASAKFAANAPSTGGQAIKTLPAGQTWTRNEIPWLLKGHGTFYAVGGVTIRGYTAKLALRAVSIGF